MKCRITANCGLFPPDEPTDRIYQVIKLPGCPRCSENFRSSGYRELLQSGEGFTKGFLRLKVLELKA